MSTNQYLPFATAGGANVLLPAAYSSLASRLSGFTAGTALSINLNSVWRQSSVVAAALGQFVGDIGGFDALDDGSVANLLLSFERTIQSQKLNYAVAGGTANAITVALFPAPAAYTDGLQVHFKAASANTGAVTIQVGSLATVALVRADGTPLQKNDIVPNAIVPATYNVTAGNFQVEGTGGVNAPIANGAQFTAATTNWTAPAGVFRVRARVWGAGGGGGSGSSSSVGAAGAGASGGGYSEGYFPVIPGTVYVVTVGAAGAGSVGPSGGSNGGTSSFSSFISATGGTGGQSGVNAVPSTPPTGSPGTGTGGYINITATSAPVVAQLARRGRISQAAAAAPTRRVTPMQSTIRHQACSQAAAAAAAQ